jgi:hypothetical protein
VSAIKTKDIRAALLKKGFRLDNTHHQYLWLFVGDRRTTVKTWLSHGLVEYDDNLLTQVKKELKVSKKQLFALVRCPLKYEAYVAHLVATGRIKTD